MKKRLLRSGLCLFDDGDVVQGCAIDTTQFSRSSETLAFKRLRVSSTKKLSSPLKNR